MPFVITLCYPQFSSSPSFYFSLTNGKSSRLFLNQRFISLVLCRIGASAWTITDALLCTCWSCLRLLLKPVKLVNDDWQERCDEQHSWYRTDATRHLAAWKTTVSQSQKENDRKCHRHEKVLHSWLIILIFYCDFCSGYYGNTNRSHSLESWTWSPKITPLWPLTGTVSKGRACKMASCLHSFTLYSILCSWGIPICKLYSSMCMCRCEGYGFKSVKFGIWSRNQTVLI